jgi:hypothetical protein
MSIQSEMISEAIEKCGNIRPTIGKAVLQDCFTVYENPKTGKKKLMLWFNDQNNSTQIVSRELN